ncbi:Uncharacterized protein ABJ99_4573 [Pseudomonas syringae pv. cilantro]|uniref:Uncharacterized protein n=1 Tax=Pseudomonas syringae pv. cilantro TaxID=81035 RepID=A0A0N0GFV4_PSESX|nr:MULTISPECIES: hypothetical protein [Pseudomonas syringae group]KPC32550.1 Uncharacterized protein ABJ99_4573 [Pseudomonas syringae pv. cilantro]KPW72990.1 Uncharacterized protein ALO76_02216 [Pseudomonas syringae pv. coriandricola]
MSNVINLFPKLTSADTINQEFFERFTDVALLLKCFQSVQDAVEFIHDGGKIEERDDSYIDLVGAYWALKVLFERRTGGDAQKVSDDHREVESRCLLAGEQPPDMHIPVAGSFVAPTPPEVYSELSDMALACKAFNSAEQIRLGTNATLAANNAQIGATLAVEAINVTTALRQLVLRLSGGSLEAMAAQIARKPGETLQ